MGRARGDGGGEDWLTGAGGRVESGGRESDEGEEGSILPALTWVVQGGLFGVTRAGPLVLVLYGVQESWIWDLQTETKECFIERFSFHFTHRAERTLRSVPVFSLLKFKDAPNTRWPNIVYDCGQAD